VINHTAVRDLIIGPQIVKYLQEQLVESRDVLLGINRPVTIIQSNLESQTSGRACHARRLAGLDGQYGKSTDGTSNDTATVIWAGVENYWDMVTAMRRLYTTGVRDQRDIIHIASRDRLSLTSLPPKTDNGGI